VSYVYWVAWNSFTSTTLLSYIGYYIQGGEDCCFAQTPDTIDEVTYWVACTASLF